MKIPRSTGGRTMDEGRREMLGLALLPAAWLLLSDAARAERSAVGAMPAIAVPDRPTVQEFLNLSEILTGVGDLDPDTARRIYALIMAEPYGPQHVSRVYERIRAAIAGDPGKTREQILDPKAFGSGERWFIGHLLVTWYTGVYYHAVGNRRVAFEAALMHRALADMRPPPTSCGDAPGYWAAPPSRLR
jgi:hypothetical protein